MTFDLASLGWDAAFAADLPRARRRRGPGPGGPGRPRRLHGAVRRRSRPRQPGRRACSPPRPATRCGCPAPATGWWCATWPDDRVTIEAVLPRRTAIVRRTADKDSSGQVLAANLDVAAVVEPLDPEPDLGRIERLLALAWESGARPLVVFTKSDAGAPTRRRWPPTWPARRPGVTVLTVSAAPGHRPRPSSARWSRPAARWACSARPAPASRRWSTRSPGPR